MMRGPLVGCYAWAVPSPDALDFVARRSGGYLIDPIAGTGYWAYLLSARGIDCLAFDQNPPQAGENKNLWHPNATPFMEVVELDAVDAVKQHGKSRSLFLSWPPYKSSVAHDVLQAYTGDTLIYIGEGRRGCTADNDFFDLIEKEWRLGDVHLLPQWDGIHDFIGVFRRIRKGGET